MAFELQGGMEHGGRKPEGARLSQKLMGRQSPPRALHWLDPVRTKKLRLARLLPHTPLGPNPHAAARSRSTLVTAWGA